MSRSRNPSIQTRFNRLLDAHSNRVADEQATLRQTEAIRVARETKRKDIAPLIRADAVATAALLVRQGKRSSETVLGKPLGGLAGILELPFWIIGYSVKSDKFRPFFDAKAWEQNKIATKMGLGLNAAGDLIVFTDANTDNPMELVAPQGHGIASDELIVPTSQINERVTVPGNQQLITYWRDQFTDNLTSRILFDNDPNAPANIQRLDQIPRLRSWREQ